MFYIQLDEETVSRKNISVIDSKAKKHVLLSLLLNYMEVSKYFAEWRTTDNVVYPTFKVAA
jgi:hypothetical protein